MSSLFDHQSSSNIVLGPPKQDSSPRAVGWYVPVGHGMQLKPVQATLAADSHVRKICAIIKLIEIMIMNKC